jgi:hypothetical protein
MAQEIVYLQIQSAHVSFSQQTDGERLRGVSRQAVLGITVKKEAFRLTEVRITEVLLYIRQPHTAAKWSTYRNSTTVSCISNVPIT